MVRFSKQVILSCLYLVLVFNAIPAKGHGSLAPGEDDICVLQVGFLKAHFKIYLPRIYQHEEFCEDLPDAAEALFVMEYQHDSLAEMLIDFRIIRDVTGQEKFAREDDVAKIGDLDAATVYYVPPQIHPDVFAAVHHFDEPGWYVGIVTATTAGGESYKAIFPFEVGYTGIGYWPILAMAIVLMLLLLWYDKKRTDALISAGDSN